MSIRIEGIRSRQRTLPVEPRRFFPAFVLAGYGLFILSLFARGVMSWYISPGYIAPTTLAGAVLVGLSAVCFARPQTHACQDGCCDAGDCECREPPVHLRTYAILSVPLLLAVLFPPRALATFSAAQRGPQIAGLTAVHGASVVHRVSLSVDTASFSLQDWAGALSADPNPRDYLGKAVNLTGLVMHDPSSVPPGYIMVLRYQVTCCIADARPVGLIVQDISRGALKDNQWVTVHGVMGSTSYQGQKIAVVMAKRIVPTKAGNPYMY